VPPACPLVAGGCGPVITTWATWASSSITTIGRVWLSETRPATLLDHWPVAGSKTRTMMSGAEPDEWLVFTAA
jgi:hypothetical protein